jgi:4'-phosphopantetheinyl transferase
LDELNILKKHPASWMPPPNSLQLRDLQIHLWRSGLNFHKDRLSELNRSLSDEEHRRSERFRFRRDRHAFIAARGILRKILSLYCDASPEHLEFDYAARGKPSLTGLHRNDDIRFNVSHSRGLALYAIVRARHVGVDVEYVRAITSMDHIAARLFLPEDCAWLTSLPRGSRQTAFYVCWTRREAYLKAKGSSIMRCVTSSARSLLSEQDTEGVAVIEEPDASGLWSVWQLDPGPGYAGALVLEGIGGELRCFQFPKEDAQTPLHSGKTAL